MKKRVINKTKLKRLLYVLLIILFIIIFVLILINKKINVIYIEGNNILKEQDILDLCKLDDYPKYKDINETKLRRYIKTNPIIKSVRIKKRLNSLTIIIEEYNILYYQSLNNCYILENGNYMENYEENNEVPSLINRVDDEYFYKFIEKMNLVDKNILSKISEIKYSPTDLDKERFLLFMNDKNYVYLTLSKFEYINYYLDTLTKLEGKKGILYLDSGNHFEIKE